MPLRLTPDIDWAKFLKRHDLVYLRLPGRWDEGAFLGNGLLGAMAYNRPDAGENPAALRFDVGRSDVAERRPKGWWRLPVGHLTVTPPAGRKIVGFDGRLSLWDAAFSGTLSTDAGAMSVNAFVCADRHVLVVEASARGGGGAPAFDWHPAVSANPRSLFKRDVEASANPEPFTEELPDGVAVCVQPMDVGGEYATAWAVTPGKAGAATLFLSVGNSREGTGERDEAVAAVRAAVAAGADALRRAHEKWWHGYLPQSFLSIPDARMESFYWLQMYKLGAATRQGGPVLDLMGPWHKDTPWPGVWWNLNVQLAYWPAYAANRLEQAATLVDHIDAHAEAFTANAPEPWRGDSAMVGRATGYDCLSVDGPGTPGGGQEVGNLTWALHNYWLHCRHAGDDARLRDRLFPLLRRAVNLYLHLLEEGDDGRLHLPPTLSPEFGVAPDANYDLALLRWGCRTLLDLSAKFGLADPLEAQWAETLDRLADFPVEWERGYHVGRGVPLDRSHRHASHLMMVYPLRLVSPERREERALIERSLDHWLGMKDAHQGYTNALGASMCALLGRREQAVRLLDDFIERYLKPNTMYLEAGPVIETPLAAANTLQDLVLRSDPGGIVRVFPCVPDSWRDVCFHDLRAEGAFLVSARRAAGRTAWVRVRSLAGEPCRLRADLQGPAETINPVGRRTPAAPDADGAYPLALRAGESVLLVPRGAQPDMKVTPVAPLPGTLANYFGVR